MSKTILIVPGFLADTYSEIEKAFVELSKIRQDNVIFLWLVPSISNRYNRYIDPADRAVLREPLYVSHLRKAGVRCVSGNISPYNIFSNALLFYRVFRKYDVQAVYTHYGFERFHAAFFARVFRRKVIWNEHWYSMGTRFVFLKRLFYTWFVDAFIAVSGFIARTLPVQVPVYVIPNAIGYRSRTADEKKLFSRKSVGIGDKDKVVLMIAAFRPEKRYDLALKVCRDILGKDCGVKFLFLGEGELRQWFLGQVALLGLSRSVIAPGYVRNVGDYYQIADIVMLTSIHEPCGYTVLEAMSHSRPVIAFASGGPQEIITNGRTGILVAEEDAAGFARELSVLLHCPERRRQLGYNAWKDVRQRFDRKQWKRTVIAALEEAIRGKEQAFDTDLGYISSGAEV